MKARPQLRAVGSREPEIANLARDAQQALDTIVRSEIIAFTRAYAEPLDIAFDHEPLGGVRLNRVQLDAEPETYLPAGGTIHFVYRRGVISITAIEGLTTGERYRFVFEAVG